MTDCVGRYTLAWMGGIGTTLRAFGLAAMLVLGAMSGAPRGAWADGPLIGVVKTTEGAVELLRGGAALAAEVGGEVHLSDRLRTGPDGAAGVTLNDGTLISLGPNSLFEFSEFEYSPKRGAFGFLGSALGGTVLYSSGKIGKLAPERTRIRTPVSVIAVRGTRFAVRLPAAGGN
ncbi:MAG: FecR family protein [Thalassobaculum sp.]|uniref:FecR family protein n=1 Tax=Thalassobaculum sp. TaxID=2022740 RepID=UPI0032EF9F9B